jgi:hypothetical protein
MVHMRKVFALLLVLTFVLALSACSALLDDSLKDLGTLILQGDTPSGGSPSGSSPSGGSPTDAPDTGTDASDAGNVTDGSPDSTDSPSTIVPTTAPDGTPLVSSKVLSAFAEGEYHWVFKSDVAGFSMMSEGWYKNGMSASASETMGIEQRIVQRDGKVWTFMPTLQMYNVQDVDAYDGSDPETWDDGMEFSQSGRRVFAGVERYFEEYVIAGYTYTYFFDDRDEFVGLEAVVDGMTVVIEVLSFDTDVPDSAFDVTIEDGWMDIGALGGMFGGS